MGLSRHTIPLSLPLPNSKGTEHSLLCKPKGQWELVTANKLDTKAASATPGYLWCSQWDSGLPGATSLTSKWPFHSKREGERASWRYRKEVLPEPTAFAFYECPGGYNWPPRLRKAAKLKTQHLWPSKFLKTPQAQDPAQKLKPRAKARGPATARTPQQPRGASAAQRRAGAAGSAGVGAARTERRRSAHPTSCSIALRSGAPRGHAAGGGRPAAAGPRRSACAVPRPRCSRASALVAARPAGAAVCGSRRCHGDEQCSAWTGSLLGLPALGRLLWPALRQGPLTPQPAGSRARATEPQPPPLDCSPSRFS